MMKEVPANAILYFLLRSRCHDSVIPRKIKVKWKTLASAIWTIKREIKMIVRSSREEIFIFHLTSIRIVMGVKTNKCFWVGDLWANRGNFSDIHLLTLPQSSGWNYLYLHRLFWQQRRNLFGFCQCEILWPCCIPTSTLLFQ